MRSYSWKLCATGSRPLWRHIGWLAHSVASAYLAAVAVVFMSLRLRCLPAERPVDPPTATLEALFLLRHLQTFPCLHQAPRIIFDDLTSDSPFAL